MPRPLPQRDHKIALADARRFAAAGRRRMPDGAAAAGTHAAAASPARAFAFHRGAIDRVLAQPGCVGVRVYPAAHDDGSATWVLVGVNEAGSDMASGELLQDPIWCPPDCDEASALASDRPAQ